MNILRASSIRKSYGGRHVLENFSCSTSGGAVLGITGPNGSGKTTILKLLAGILSANGGSVELSLDENKITDAGITPHVAFVGPYLAMHEMMTSREFVTFACELRNVRDVAHRALEEVGLEDRADDLLKNYSSGMLQRVRFAVAKAVDAPVLLLDEPTITLDEEGIALLDNFLAEAKRAEKIIVIATNDVRDLERCDQICHILKI